MCIFVGDIWSIFSMTSHGTCIVVEDRKSIVAGDMWSAYYHWEELARALSLHINRGCTIGSAYFRPTQAEGVAYCRQPVSCPLKSSCKKALYILPSQRIFYRRPLFSYQTSICCIVTTVFLPNKHLLYR